MYLPPGSTLLRFLEAPLSFLSSGQQTLSSGVASANGHHSKDLNNLGNLSPYHDAPAVCEVDADLPDDCTVNQVILLHRHGSRGPVYEQNYILRLVDTLDQAWDVIQEADLPPYLEFLRDGYKYQLVPHQLTIPGRKELFDHGVEFALRYPTFSTDTVVSTDVPRVIDSAHFFSQGFFGRGAEKIKYRTTNNFTDPVSWLAPWKSCPKLTPSPAFQASQKWMENYVPPIVDKLNELIPGVGFTLNDTRGALYACPYDVSAGHESPWCDVFTTHELQGLEYELDLYFDVFSGHKSKGDAGPLVGAFYIKKLIERLNDTTKDAKPLYLEFAHDVSILLVLSTLELNKDAESLNPYVHHPPAYRKFRTSHQTPFAAQMVWERFTCTDSFKGPQVRLVLNGATFPLSICEESGGDKRYGTCSLDAFVRANKYSMDVKYHSKTWNETCEH